MPAKEQTVELHANNFKGLVLNPSVLGVETNAATLCSNIEKNASGQITVRPGTRTIYRARDASSTYDFRAMFPFTYTYYDTATGATKEEQLGLVYELNGSYVQQDPYLVKRVSNTLTVNFISGGTASIVITPNLNALNQATWKCVVTVDAVVVLTYFFAAANTAAVSATDISDFVAEIHALADFTCSPTSITGDQQFCPVDLFAAGYSVSFAGASSTTITYYTFESVGTGTAAPLTFTDANFILPSALNYSNVIYFAYGTYEHKYDGLEFYRSGLPQATINAIADSAGGTAHTLGNVYIYKLVYSRKDAKGNIIDGEDSDDTLAVATHTMVATRDIDLTVNNITASSYPDHALKGAKVNGAQAGVTTITVDAGHTLEVGDTAYFYDGVSSSYVERVITGTAATTITISGANVNVADNIFISNNVRIQIWRTKDSGVDFYFVDEIPNDPSSATQVYLDDVPDSSLTELFTEQLRKHSEPPKCSYVGEHQGLKLLAGDPDNPNRLYWALPNDIEAYPLEANNTDIRGGGLGALTGFGTVDDDVLAVFKSRGHVLVDGSLDDLNFKVINKADTGIGCTSFRTLAYLGDSAALTGLSLQGVFIFNGRTPDLAVSQNIKPIFESVINYDEQVNDTPVPNSGWSAIPSNPLDADIPLVFKRATAINDSFKDQYHLYIPGEIGVPSDVKFPLAAGSQYLVYNYDTTKLYWTNYNFYLRLKSGANVIGNQGNQPNAAAGFCMFENKVYMGAIIGSSSEIYTDIVEHKQGITNADYIESAFPVYKHLHYIPFVRTLGSPTGFFKPLRILVYKFLSRLLNDPLRTVDFGDNFTLNVSGVANFKSYAGVTKSTDVNRTFKVEQGQTAMVVKCATTKANAYQIVIDNDDVSPIDYVPPVYDNIEFVYCTPYDPKQKDPKAQNG